MCRSESVRSSSKLALAAFVLALAPVLDAAPVPPTPRPRHVHGNIVSQLLTGPACTSPVGLCTKGHFTGSLRGEFVFTATTLTPTADTPATGIVHYTGDIVLKTNDGTIFIKDAGAFDSAPGSTGDVGAVSAVTGGTRRYAGASGHVRIGGTFTPQDGGDSEYCGQILLR